MTRYCIRYGRGWWDGSGILFSGDEQPPEALRLSKSAAQELLAEFRRQTRLAGYTSGANVTRARAEFRRQTRLAGYTSGANVTRARLVVSK